LLKDGLYHWGKWEDGENHTLKHQGDLNHLDDGGKFIDSQGKEFTLKNGEFIELNYGISAEEADNTFEPDYHNASDFPFVGQFTNDMVDNYYPTSDNDIVTDEYVTDIPAGKILKRGDILPNIDYDTASDETIVTLQYLMENTDKIPRTDPCNKGMVGVLWSPDGINVVLSGGVDQACPVFKMTVTSPSAPTFSDVSGGSIIVNDNRDGTFTCESQDNITSFRVNGSEITKIEVQRMKTVISLRQAFYLLTNMAEFICPFEETQNVTDFERAWMFCSGLTSFPSLDVSSGTDFNSAWYNCTSLPSCPGTDGTVTIPAGADTTGMCYGI
jgi:hypothetical protein